MVVVATHHDEDPYDHLQYMKSVKHLLCWQGMWGPFHVGLEPQLLHSGMVCSPALKHYHTMHTSGDFQNFGPTHVVVTT